MKKQITLVMCCLAFMVTGIAQPLMGNLEREKQKTDLFQTKPEWFPKPNTQPKGADWWEPDTITYSYDSHGKDDLQMRRIFSYNGNGNCLLHLEQMWNNSQWNNNRRYIYTYEKSLLMEELNEDWISGAWKKNYLDTYEYDIQNNLKVYIHQQADWETGELKNFLKDTFEYDTKNNLKVRIHKIADWETGEWKNNQKDTFEYDTQNNLKLHISQNTDWETGEWINNEKNTYEYDAQSNLKLRIHQSTDWETGELVNYEKDTFEYNIQNMVINHKYYIWNSNEWEVIREKSYEYDIHNNLKEWITTERGGQSIRITYMFDDYYNREEEIRELWESGQWMKQFKSVYSYDDHNNATDGLGKKWEKNDWIDGNSVIMNVYYNNMKSCWELASFWMPYSYFKASYVNTSTLSVKEKTFETHVNIYPNPTNGELRITNDGLPIVNVELFDMMGRKLYAESRMENREWSMNLSAFQTGIYLLKIHTEKEILIKKIIKN